MGTAGWISPHIDVSDLATFKKGYELLATTKVKKVMSAKPVTVEESTYIAEVARLRKTELSEQAARATALSGQACAMKTEERRYNG
jgi:signal-transduction protein with cAMP-binding, CBS, and nucleotidyltransferase domain